ncbi:MAG: hypothetical protein E7276_01965 [Pseudobutyrivibrio sp.]|nr:hypothetical protein [Pseudobutyrivibrio sp.]
MNIINGCNTDVGIKKPVNQDRILSSLFVQDSHYLFLGGIFDGISSLKDSEQVADLIKSRFQNWFEDYTSRIDLSQVDMEIVGCHLLDTLDEVEEDIYNMRQNGECNGGSTATIILILDSIYNVFHLGDSKLVLVKNGSATQLTEDQTVLGSVNGITKYFLDNYMGKDVECDYLKYSGQLEIGDCLFYGSDGFFGKTLPEELLQLEQQITEQSSLDTVLSNHTEILKLRGETDNISVGVFKVVI